MSLKSPIIFPVDAKNGSDLLLRLGTMKKSLSGCNFEKNCNRFMEITQLMDDCYQYILTNSKMGNECLGSHKALYEYLNSETSFQEDLEKDNTVGSSAVHGYSTPPSSKSYSNNQLNGPNAGHMGPNIEDEGFFYFPIDVNSALVNPATPATP